MFSPSTEQTCSVCTLTFGVTKIYAQAKGKIHTFLFTVATLWINEEGEHSEMQGFKFRCLVQFSACVRDYVVPVFFCKNIPGSKLIPNHHHPESHPDHESDMYSH